MKCQNVQRSLSSGALAAKKKASEPRTSELLVKSVHFQLADAKLGAHCEYVVRQSCGGCSEWSIHAQVLNALEGFDDIAKACVLVRR